MALLPTLPPSPHGRTAWRKAAPGRASGSTTRCPSQSRGRRQSHARLVRPSGGGSRLLGPGALLPQHDARWEETGEPNLARAIITHGSLEQAIEIAVAENGQTRWVQYQRWSNANPEKALRLQPFGCYLDNFQKLRRLHPAHQGRGRQSLRYGGVLSVL
ncbi:DUF6544 family protein [Billgrantia sulfidoxydans]|uniref:DUF6544 family protein n=1 Tax=Billgrantia sulfidoxydans TaxID=2733484 RepID=UPI003BEF331A